MHIPEGYLSPQSCGVMGAVMIPIWLIASKKVSQKLGKKNIPFMALGATFSFIVMMFNVPIPDGSTAHAIGATLLAITLGPWAATIAISIALLIQALLFGDGGILAIGANCFNMAFLPSMLGYLIFRLLTKFKTNKVIAAGIGAYLGINIAATITGIELGLQPLLFHTANGSPLYFPYGLNLAVPAMLFAHLTVAGIVEAVITGLVIYYLQKVDEENILYRVTHRLKEAE